MINKDNKYYRCEAIEAQAKYKEGSRLISTPVSYLITSCLIVIFILIIIVFMVNVDYSRRELVTGRLIPTGDFAGVYASQSGLISKVLITEGSDVKYGQSIAELESTIYTKSGQRVTSLLIDNNKEKISEIIKSIKNEKNIFKLYAEEIENEISLRKIQLNKKHDLSNIIHDKIDISQLKLKRYENLLSESFISQDIYDDEKNNLLSYQESLNKIKSQEFDIGIYISSLESNLYLQKLESTRNLSALSERLSELRRQQIQNEVNDTFIITSSLNGVISGVQIKPGQLISAHEQIATIVPKNSSLEVELFVPTKSISFVKIRSSVRIHINAYPFQKYGFLKGRVKSISKAVVNSEQLDGYNGNEKWLYKVVVSLNKEDSTFNKFILHPGMELSAYLFGDRRSIFEWIFESIISVKKGIE